MSEECDCTACLILYEPADYLKIIRENISCCLDSGFKVLVFNNDPNIDVERFLFDGFDCPRSNICLHTSEKNVGYLEAVKHCADLIYTSHLTLVDQDDRVFEDFLLVSSTLLTLSPSDNIAFGGNVLTVFGEERIKVGINQSSKLLINSSGLSRLIKLYGAFDDTMLYLVYPKRFFANLPSLSWEDGIAHAFLTDLALSNTPVIYIDMPMREYLAKGQKARRAHKLRNFGWFCVLKSRLRGIYASNFRQPESIKYFATIITLIFCIKELGVKAIYRIFKKLVGRNASRRFAPYFRRLIRRDDYIHQVIPESPDVVRRLDSNYFDSDWLL